MTPMMHERVRNMFGDAGLTAGFTVQKLMYDDPEDLTQAVMVFRPNGGSNIRHDLGSEHHVLVDVICAKDKRGDAANAVQRIVDYVQPIPWLMSVSATSRTWAQFPRRCSQKKGE